MQTKFIENGDHQPKWIVIADIEQRNAINQHLHPLSQRLLAERMKADLERFYEPDTRVYINYRKTKIAVKVASHKIKNRRQLRLSEKKWEKQGITKRASTQGFIYSIRQHSNVAVV